MAQKLILDMLFTIFMSCVIKGDASLFAPEKCQNNGGTEFIVMFLQSDRAGEPMRLYMNTDVDHEVKVTIRTPTWISANAVNLDVNVVAGNTTVVELPDQLRLKGCTIDNKLVHLSATAHITLHASSIQSFSGDAFIVYPVSVLGTEYIAHSRNTSSTKYLVGIAALNDQTTVEVKLPNGAYIVNGTTFTSGMVTVLHRFQVLQLWIRDATYVIVKADKIISVNNGHVFENVDTISGTSFDHTEEQLLPISMWSKGYIVAPALPYSYDGYGENVKIFGYYHDTTVEITDPSTTKIELKLADSGSFHEFFIKSGEAVIIKSNKEIGVFQYGVSSPRPDLYHSEAYLMQVTGTDQYVRYVTFPAIFSSNNQFNSSIMIVSSKNALNNIILNNHPITPSWTNIGSSDYSFTYVEIKESYNVLTTTAGDGFFTAVLSGVGKSIQYGLAVGKYVSDSPRPNGQGSRGSDENRSRFSWKMRDFVPSYAPLHSGSETFLNCFGICHDMQSCGYIVFNNNKYISCRIYEENASCSNTVFENGSNVYHRYG